jgi:hypothetical protein
MGLKRRSNHKTPNFNIQLPLHSNAVSIDRCISGVQGEFMKHKTVQNQNRLKIRLNFVQFIHLPCIFTVEIEYPIFFSNHSWLHCYEKWVYTNPCLLYSQICISYRTYATVYWWLFGIYTTVRYLISYTGCYIQGRCFKACLWSGFGFRLSLSVHEKCQCNILKHAIITLLKCMHQKYVPCFDFGFITSLFHKRFEQVIMMILMHFWTVRGINYQVTPSVKCTEHKLWWDRNHTYRICWRQSTSKMKDKGDNLHTNMNLTSILFE